MKPTKEILADLYLSQRLTTRAIGEKFGFSKTTIKRWLILDGIPLRPSGRGLAHRGQSEPSAVDLHNMIHTQQMTYTQVAEKYGVDYTAVPHWLTKHGIAKTSKSGRKAPAPIANEAKMVELYSQGASTVHLANIFSTSAKFIAKRLKANGVTLRLGGFKGKRFTCNDGDIVMSIYEQRVDNWLSFYGFAHTVEPKLPFSKRSRADFLVGDTYIEVWGVVGSAIYAERRKRKTEQYHKNGLKLIELQAHDFDVSRKKTFDKILAKAFLEQL